MTDYAAVAVTIISETEAMHTRCWDVPVAFAGDLAVQCAAQFGEPHEMISDARVMAAAGEQAAADGLATYLFHDEVGRD